MPSKTRPEAGPSDAVRDAVDRLLAGPFDAFVSTRRELAAAFRAAGDVSSSRAIAAASKPSRTAWALNQVARRRPELVEATFEAWARAAAAQTTGESEALRATARAYRERLAELVGAAGDAVREDGGELTVAQGRRISATMQAVAGANDAAAREALCAGRLVADIDVDDPFAGLALGPQRERREVAPAPRDDLAARRKVAEAGRAHAREREDAKQAREREDAKQAREREDAKQAREREEAKQAREREEAKQARELENARARVSALEDEARAARAAARVAEIAAGRAQAEAQHLRRAVEAVEKRLGEARGDVRSRTK